SDTSSSTERSTSSRRLGLHGPDRPPRQERARERLARPRLEARVMASGGPRVHGRRLREQAEVGRALVLGDRLPPAKRGGEGDGMKRSGNVVLAALVALGMLFAACGPQPEPGQPAGFVKLSVALESSLGDAS